MTAAARTGSPAGVRPPSADDACGLDANGLNSHIGFRLRALREASGMTLTELARAAGMSKAHLSRLESGERSFSLANLLALTTRLGVPVASILPASGDRSGDVVSSEGTGTIVRAANLQVRPLTRRADAVLQPFHVLVPVDRAWSSGATHPGEEWIYVLRGVLRVEHDDQTDILHKGDSIHLDATKPHRLVATVEAELIVVADSGT